MTQRILFLDIDGVLNSEEFMRSRCTIGGQRPDLDPQAVGLLNTVVERSGCAVVLSTYWREERSVEWLVEHLVKHGLSESAAIVGATGVIRSGDFRDCRERQRGYECAAWIESHAPGAVGVMLDDNADCADLPLVQTDWQIGLTAEDADMAVEAFGWGVPMPQALHLLTPEARLLRRVRGTMVAT